MPLKIPPYRKLLATCIAAAMSTGCAANGWGPRVAHPHAHLLAGGSADASFGFAIEEASSDLEREPRDDSQERDDGKRPVSPALLWTGVIIGTVGLVTLATGVGLGVSSEKRIDEGDASGISRADRDALVQRGEFGNRLAIGGGSVLFVGGSLAAIVGAMDYSRCGPMISKKRRNECDAGRTDTSESE